MKSRTTKMLIAVALIAAVFAAVAIILRRPSAPEYEITDLGIIKGDGHPTAINNEGYVVGNIHVPGSGDPSKAYIWSPEKGRRSIPALDGKESRAYDINDKGQVVGYFSKPGANTPDYAFIWDEETGLTELGTLGGRDSLAFAVNNKGQVAGFSKEPNGQEHAFIWDRANGMRDLGTLGGKSCATDINEKGQVIGTLIDPNGQERAFFRDQDTGMVDIGTLGGPVSRATGINNSGQVVGGSLKKGAGRCFIWELGTGMTELDIEGQGFGDMRINDSGQAVCYRTTPKFLFFKKRRSLFLWDVNRGAVELNLGLENGGSISSLDINNRGQILVSIYTSIQNQVIILTPKDKSKPTKR